MARASKRHGEPMKLERTYTGPIKERSCTDLLCLAIFVLFILLWIILFVFLCKYGYPKNIAIPRDHKGQLCGISPKVDTKPYLFYFNILSCNPLLKHLGGCSTRSVCVESCPQKTFSVKGVLANINFSNLTKENLKKEIICDYDYAVPTDEEKLKKSIAEGVCADIYIASRPVLGRCLPFFDILDEQLLSKLMPERSSEFSLSKIIHSIVNSIFYLPGVYEILAEDLENIWHYLFGALVVAMILSLIWIVLMGMFSAFFIYGSIFLVYALLATGMYYSFTTYKFYHSPPYNCSETATLDLEPAASKCTTWYYIGISLAVVTGILSLILLFLRKRIALAIPLIKEGSKLIMAHLSTLAFPIIIFAMKAGVIGLCLYFLVSAESLGATPEYDYTLNSEFLKEFCEKHKNNTIDATQIYRSSEVAILCFLENIGGKRVLLILHLYNLFFFFWLMAFTTGFNHLSLAGVFATHYWTFDKRELPRLALLTSVYHALRYHIGSLALGSFLIALFKFIRHVIMMISKEIKKYENSFTRIIRKLCICCLWLFEKFLQFISKNAYIMIAIYGKNFCTSARLSFNLILRNVLRVWVLTKILHFLFFMGKLVIVLAMGSLTYFYLEGTFFNPGIVVRYTAFPIVLVVICSYIVASIFFQVFQVAVDTLFLCFLEDCEKNDGSASSPYYMPRNLMKVLGKKNKFKELPEDEPPERSR